VTTSTANELGITGFQVYDMLKADYNIQLELAESYVILAVVGIGDDESTLQYLVKALQDIAARYYGTRGPFRLKQAEMFEKPMTVVSPREAFFSPKRVVSLQDAVQGIIDHYRFYREQNCVVMTNADDPDQIHVLGEDPDN
jgi:hypothetical protein